MILGIDCSRYGLQQPTGVEVVTNHVVEGLIPQLDRLGYDEVRLYVKNPEQKAQLAHLVAENSQTRVNIVFIKRAQFWTLIGLTKEMLKNPIDHLFVPSHELALWNPSRTTWMVHGLEIYHFPEAYTRKQRSLQKYALWRARRSAAKLIAVSEAVRKDLVKFGGFKKKQVSVVPLGFDVPQDMEEVTLPKLLEGQDYILSVGRIEKRKNQIRLLRAFENIAGYFPKLQLVLVGSKGYGFGLVKRAILRSDFVDRIHMMGYQPRSVVLTLMKKARLFAYPSLAEGFGLPILEAFYAGVPVLTSKGSACEEVGGEVAEYCDPESVESIEGALRKVLGSKKLQKEMVRKGKERCQDYSWQRCVDQIAEQLKA